MADKRPTASDEPPAAANSRGGVVGQLRSAVAPTLADPFRLALTLAVNAAIVGGIVGTAIILRNYKPPPKPPTLEPALAALDQGKDDEARQLALRLAAKPDITNEEWGGPDFVFGALAEKAAEADSRQEAQRGISPGRPLFEALARAGISCASRSDGALLAGQVSLRVRPLG